MVQPLLEPKRSYRSIKEEVPDEPDTVPIGEVDPAREGDHLTFVTLGAILQPVLEAVDELVGRASPVASSTC